MWIVRTTAFLFVSVAGLLGKEVPFDLPTDLPVKAVLVVPDPAEVVTAPESTSRTRAVSVRLPEEAESPGMVAEVRDGRGRRLWSKSFDYDVSAARGNKVTVSWNAKATMMLVEYEGYKWNHRHHLLLVRGGKAAPVVSEYKGEADDILPVLRKHERFAQDHKYRIYPLRFVNGGVEFECIPLAPAGRAHPFAQDETWFLVTAQANVSGRFVPQKVTTQDGH